MLNISKSGIAEVECSSFGCMMSSVELLLVVNLLKDGCGLVENIEEFCDHLGVPHGDKLRLLGRYRADLISCHALIYNILMNWISRKGSNATVGRLLKSFGNMGNKYCSDALEDLMKSLSLEPPYEEITITPINQNSNQPEPGHLTPSSNYPILFGISCEVFNFTGRARELSQLKELYTSQYPGVLITGLGGIGKTQLVKKFLQGFKIQSQTSGFVAVWLSGESSTTIRSSLENFASSLQIQIQIQSNAKEGVCGKPDLYLTQELNLKPLLEDILKKLLESKSKTSSSCNPNPRWIFVIDNVDENVDHPEFQTITSKLLSIPNIFLIVTSRRRDIFPLQLELLPLPLLEMEDAIDFIKSSLQISGERQHQAEHSTVKELCEFVDNLPLALQQIIAFIRQRRRGSLRGSAYGVATYLSELKTSSSTSTSTRGLDIPTGFEGYSKTLVNVWDMSLSSIFKDYGQVGKIAVELIQILAFLLPDQIPLKLISKLHPQFYTSFPSPSEAEITEGLELLLLHSLITINENICSEHEHEDVIGNEKINIHRLTQHVIRHKMETCNQSGDVSVIFTSDVEKLTRFWETIETLPTTFSDMPHIYSIRKHSLNHPSLVDSFPRISHPGMKNVKPQKCQNANDVTDDTHRFVEFFCANQQFFSEILGDTMNLSDLTFIESMEGQTEKSLDNFKEVYKKAKDFFGAESEFTIGFAQRISMISLHLKRYEESLIWSEIVLDLFANVEGKLRQDERIIFAKGAMADALFHLDRVAEAKELYQEAFDWCQGKYRGEIKIPRRFSS